MCNWFTDDIAVWELTSVHGDYDKGSISNKWRKKWIHDFGLGGWPSDAKINQNPQSHPT